MKTIIVILLILPVLSFSQPSVQLVQVSLPANSIDSLTYTRTESQIEEMEAFYLANPQLKSAMDANILLDSTRIYQFKSLNDSTLIDRTLLSYNPTGSLKMKMNYFWNDVMKKILENKYEYFYDRTGKLTTINNYEWYINRIEAYVANDGVFHPEQIIANLYFFKYQYSYDKLGRQTNYVYYIQDPTYGWTAWENYNYFYNAAGTKISMSKNSLLGGYASYKEEYTYDVNQNLSIISKYNQVSGNQLWICTSRTKYEYTYNSDKRVTRLLSYYWSFEASEWKNVSKVDYTYQINGSLQSRLYSIIDTTRNELMQVNRTNYTYNKNDKIHLREDFAWNKTINEWELRKKQYYYYNYLGPTLNLNESDLDKDFPFKIFPNPAKEILRFENTSNFTFPIQIYNDNGQCVKISMIEKGLNTINLLKFPEGIYFITIPLKNELSSYKLIIE